MDSNYKVGIEDSFFSNESNEVQGLPDKNDKEINNNHRLIQGNEESQKIANPNQNQASDTTKSKNPGQKQKITKINISQLNPLNKRNNDMMDKTGADITQDNELQYLNDDTPNDKYNARGFADIINIMSQT